MSPSGRAGSVTREAHSRAAITDSPEPGGPEMMTTFFRGSAHMTAAKLSLMSARQRAKAARWSSRSSKTRDSGFKIWRLSVP